MAYGEAGAAAGHGECPTGLQFEADHLRGASPVWPGGYGYYVEGLSREDMGGKKEKGPGNKGGEGDTGDKEDTEGYADRCNGISNEVDCLADACTWCGIYSQAFPHGHSRQT